MNALLIGCNIQNALLFYKSSTWTYQPRWRKLALSAGSGLIAENGEGLTNRISVDKSVCRTSGLAESPLHCTFPTTRLFVQVTNKALGRGEGSEAPALAACLFSPFEQSDPVVLRSCIA